MNRFAKTMIALLTGAVMLLSFSACGNKTEETTDGATGEAVSAADNALLEGLLIKLTNDSEYTSWKEAFESTEIEETIKDDGILISAKGSDGIEGDFTFTQDGDYLVCTAAEDDMNAYTFMNFMKRAVCDYYNMPSLLVSGYIAAKTDNRYFITETKDGQTTFKIYDVAKWDMSDLGDVYIDDETFQNLNSDVSATSGNLFINLGTITCWMLGSEDRFILMTGEYGGNTDLTYRSIMTVVNDLRPEGYEAFAEAFTELKEVSGDGYTVTMGIPEDLEQDASFPRADGYKYVTVQFGKTAQPDES